MKLKAILQKDLNNCRFFRLLKAFVCWAAIFIFGLLALSSFAAVVYWCIWGKIEWASYNPYYIMILPGLGITLSSAFAMLIFIDLKKKKI